MQGSRSGSALDLANLHYNLDQGGKRVTVEKGAGKELQLQLLVKGDNQWAVDVFNGLRPPQRSLEEKL